MTYEPVTGKFTVQEIKTDETATMAVYPNTEGVLYAKKPDGGIVYTPVSKDKVCTFQIVTIKIICNTDSF
jgi:prophage tail gpP-like protein